MDHLYALFNGEIFNCITKTPTVSWLSSGLF